jgi:histidinol dehydrogenase
MITKYTEKPLDILAKRWPTQAGGGADLLDYVRPIVEDVKSRGDEAVKEYTSKFDKVELSSFLVTKDEIQEAYKQVSQDQIEALRESRKRLEIIESIRLSQMNFETTLDGVSVTCATRPLEKVGCYVPGGKAAYPSSLIMNVTPAKVAGVPRIIVCTPPGKDGKVTPLTLVAADICMVDEVYKVGGIQAVAGLAYGTETIPRVDKIVGPGNAYVTAAKTIVSETVAIDKPAGPSEILVIADETAKPKLIALDLISQAEHGEGGISGLVTTSNELADRVIQELTEMVPDLERGEITKSVLETGGFVYVVETIDEAISFSNEFAPEHIAIMTGIPEEVAEKITNSGLVLLGDYTPVSSTDYCMGVNHVLPTEGYAKVTSGITVLDYVKPVSIVKSTRPGLHIVRKKVAAIAEVEGLPNHREAVEGRFRWA